MQKSLLTRRLWSKRTRSHSRKCTSSERKPLVQVHSVWWPSADIESVSRIEHAKLLQGRRWRTWNNSKLRYLFSNSLIIHISSSCTSISKTIRTSISSPSCALVESCSIRSSKRNSSLKLRLHMFLSNSWWELIIVIRLVSYTEIWSQKTSYMKTKKIHQTLKLLTLVWVKYS